MNYIILDPSNNFALGPKFSRHGPGGDRKWQQQPLGEKAKKIKGAATWPE